METVSAPAAPSDLIRSVSRALRLLEEVGRHPAGASAKQVARACELHQSTAYHLLRTLAYEGYLEHLPSGDYVVGKRLADRYADLISVRSARSSRGSSDRRASLR